MEAKWQATIAPHFETSIAISLASVNLFLGVNGFGRRKGSRIERLDCTMTEMLLGTIL
jgi:hypothetical protein